MESFKNQLTLTSDSVGIWFIFKNLEISQMPGIFDCLGIWEISQMPRFLGIPNFDIFDNCCHFLLYWSGAAFLNVLFKLFLRRSTSNTISEIFNFKSTLNYLVIDNIEIINMMKIRLTYL